MAGTSLLALIDDIATLLDDVTVMTKIAAQKTSGVLGDDLALNAEQVSGVDASREIPVVLAVAKGSLLNKVILVPCALLLSAFLPMVIHPLLLLGGLFLCFEGFEKVYEKLFHHAESESKNSDPTSSLSQELSASEKAELEKAKIRGAIRTDFILSAEIIVIALGTVSEKTLGQQSAVLCLIALFMTVGVYGIVAGIVKMDDLGLYLLKQSSPFKKHFGRFLLLFAPRLMKSLGVIGTIAMFLVGGSLVSHSLPFFHGLSDTLPSLVWTAAEGIIGIVAGGLVMGLIHGLQRFKPKNISSL